MLPSRDFKSLASTNFATRASGNRGGLAPPTVLFDPEALRTSASDRVLYSELGHPALAILIHPCAFGIKHKAQQMPTKKHLSNSTPIKKWRLEPESNRCTRLCRPLRSHSATAPSRVDLRFQSISGKTTSVRQRGRKLDVRPRTVKPSI